MAILLKLIEIVEKILKIEINYCIYIFENYLLFVILGLFCLAFVYALIYQSILNSQKEKKNFKEINSIIYNYFKTNLFYFISAIFTFVILMIILIYKDFFVGIIAVTIYGIVLGVGSVISNPILLVLVIIAFILFGIYKKMS